MSKAPRTPWWVWLIIGVLAALQPCVLLGTRYLPPDGTVPTGLQIPDSALFLYSMDMFDNGFASAYATCQAEAGSNAITYYSVPHLWLYGLLGAVARLLHVDLFLFYGVVNGLGAFLYLWIVYRLLIQMLPRHAGRAFLLFALSGGPGGLLYLLTGFVGLHTHPAFETYFTRFALYELMEGPNLNPALYFPRLYYTLSLALCLGGLLQVIRALRTGRYRALALWCVPLMLGSFINARYAVFAGLLVMLCIAYARDTAWQSRIRLAALYAVPAGAGMAASYALMHTNPAVVDNHLQVANMAMWLSPFLAVAWLHLVLAARPMGRTLKAMRMPGRLLGCAGLCYLAAYTIGYGLYQLYYGNLLAGKDGSVAAAVSDPALLGALIGAGLAFIRRGERGEAPTPPWIALWLLGFLAVSLSGFGGGWFLRFGPQRLQVFLWLPLCIYAAVGLDRLPNRSRAVALAILLSCGITSVLVATFGFQGPLGRTGARGPYVNSHAEIMSQADAAVLAALHEGTVLAPAPASDVVVRQHGNPVVFGIGSFNLTDRAYLTLRKTVDVFFHPACPPKDRRRIVDDWCVTYVYCPDTWPVDARVIEQLRSTMGLEEVASKDRAALFRVISPK